MLKRVLHSNFYKFTEPKASKVLTQEFREFNDNVRAFLNDILPQLVNPLAPYSLLYDMYCVWLRKNNPSSICIGKKSFIADVREIVSSNPNWEIKDTPIPTRNLLSKVEPLVIQYGISWTANKTSYTGLMRVTP